MINYIIGYYIFNLQQYLIHKIQHINKIYKTHREQHHKTYDRNNITKIIKKNSLYENIDLYLYGNIICILINLLIFDIKIIIFQIFIGFLSYYFHNEYHNSNSIWKKYKFFEYLKSKHQLHHIFPNKNHFLLDPTFDILFNTYK